LSCPVLVAFIIATNGARLHDHSRQRYSCSTRYHRYLNWLIGMWGVFFYEPCLVRPSG